MTEKVMKVINPKEVKMYKCPSCGKESQFSEHSNCEICSIAICYDCRQVIEFHGEWGYIWLCKKHFTQVKCKVKAIINDLKKENINA